MGEILRQAADLPADLLVLGTHGHGGFEEWVLGSVAEKVLRKAPCPVLTFARPGAADRPKPVFRSILCAVDFSDASLQGLEWALSLAQQAAGRGKPGEQIVRAAQERGSELVVMGARGRGPLARLFLGSTVHHVVRASDRPS